MLPRCRKVAGLLLFVPAISMLPTMPARLLADAGAPCFTSVCLGHSNLSLTAEWRSRRIARTQHAIIIPRSIWTSPKAIRNENDLGKKSQVDRFKEAARELETDDSEERFNDIVRELAKQKKDKNKGKED